MNVTVLLTSDLERLDSGAQVFMTRLGALEWLQDALLPQDEQPHSAEEVRRTTVILAALSDPARSKWTDDYVCYEVYETEVGK